MKVWVGWLKSFFRCPWWLRHRSLIFAVAFTVAIAAAVLLGKYQPSRAIFPLSVVWALAFHSMDNRNLVNTYKMAVQHGVEGLAVAAADLRAGQSGRAVEAIVQTAEVVAEDVQVANAAQKAGACRS